jgi:hypothetical protein
MTLPSAAGGATQTQPGLGNMSLTGPTGTVTFQYNPSQVKFEKSQITHSRGTIQETQEQAVTDVKELTFTIDDLRMEGKEALKDIKLLFDWLIMDPGKPAPPQIGAHRKPAWQSATPTKAGDAKPAAKGGNQRGTPKILALQMGTTQLADGNGVSCNVILKKVTVAFVRFDKTGDPTRAKLTLMLELHEQPPKGTNPTSFSPAGGRVHVTTAGDNLQGIAAGTYADPSAWRDIAEANDIDDPLRVRNGRSLFLPYSRAQGSR